MCLSGALLGFDPEWPWTEIQRGQISDLRRLAVCRPISLKFKEVVPLCIANNVYKFHTDRSNDRVKIEQNIFKLFLKPLTFRHLMADFIETQLRSAD